MKTTKRPESNDDDLLYYVGSFNGSEGEWKRMEGNVNNFLVVDIVGPIKVIAACF